MCLMFVQLRQRRRQRRPLMAVTRSTPRQSVSSNEPTCKRNLAESFNPCVFRYTVLENGVKNDMNLTQKCVGAKNARIRRDSVVLGKDDLVGAIVTGREDRNRCLRTLKN